MSVFFSKLSKCPYCLNSDPNLIKYNNNIHSSDKGLSVHWRNMLWKNNREAYKKLVVHETMAFCSLCKCFYKIELPSVELLNDIYENVYSDQSMGHNRYQSLFHKKEFCTNTLEVGGGKGGISLLCHRPKVAYYNLDPNSDNMPENLSTWNIEKLRNVDLLYLRSLNIQNIVACDVIEHLYQPYKLFELASIVLPAKGKFFLHVGQFHESNPASDGSLIKDQAINIQVLHLTSACSDTIHYMARKYGFHILENETKDRTAFVLQRI